ncbi:MAG TPA: CBS domain-containing protein, partial [Bryobacteraceae bacterium]|nr:CBS domain-containing protein [Bryobacteraceae bacterium]
LLISAMLAHATTVLLLKRSILTEKVARRGFHLTREYETDPLEILFAREVMRTKVIAFPASATVGEVRATLTRGPAHRGQHLYPVVDAERRVQGVVTRKQMRELAESKETTLKEIVSDPVVAHADEPLRIVVSRMAETGLTRLPVTDGATGKLVGMISLRDLLQARVRNLHEERRRERVLRVRLPFAETSAEP